MATLISTNSSNNAKRRIAKATRTIGNMRKTVKRIDELAKRTTQRQADPQK